MLILVPKKHIIIMNVLLYCYFFLICENYNVLYS